MCNLCPRNCKTDRKKEKGFCGVLDKMVVARCGKHFWEEPPISGENGSGTIFFSGCNLKCVFCQNYKISAECFGKEITEDELCEIILRLQDSGVHNINFVTGTHFADKIASALDKIKDKLYIPTVYNCGGYEKEETLLMLKDYIDIYIPDFKYFRGELSLKYSGAKDYFEIAKKAVDICIKNAGKPQFFENGIMKKGVVIRHLVLPGFYKDSIEILKYLDKTYEKDEFLLSLMSQFVPVPKCAEYKEINRKITTFEYEKAASFAREKGFLGFFQERSSAKSEYTPDFDLTGI